MKITADPLQPLESWTEFFRREPEHALYQKSRRSDRAESRADRSTSGGRSVLSFIGFHEKSTRSRA